MLASVDQCDKYMSTFGCAFVAGAGLWSCHSFESYVVVFGLCVCLITCPVFVRLGVFVSFFSFFSAKRIVMRHLFM